MYEKKYIIELLPYSRNCLLHDFSLRKRIISLLNYLFEEMLTAINSFSSRDFLSFDPHVGENLCQIRAVQLMDLREEFLSNNTTDIKNVIIAAMRRLSSISEQEIAEIFNNEKEPYILSDFLDKLQINIEISLTVYYLFLCYFLTRFRTFNSAENTVIDYRKLIDAVRISKNLARKIIHEYQKKLSLESSLYIEKLVDTIKTGNINRVFLKETCKIDDDGRTVYPCFLVTDIILYKLMAMKLDLFCLIRTDVVSEKKLIGMRFVFNEQKKQYDFSKEEPSLKNESPALIVHGITCSELKTDSELNQFIDFFKGKGIYQIMMAGMADHPQYSGKKLAAIQETLFF